MANKLNKCFILLLFVLAFVCIFFPTPGTDFAEAAAIGGVSGNQFILTNYVGSAEKHFFVDDNKESTLVNAVVKAGDTYYSIVSSGNGTSSGWGEFRPTLDMQPFIEKGLLYASASATVTTKNGTTMTIKISSGEDFEQVVTSGGEVSTPRLQIKDYNQNIRFTFEATSTNGKNNFVMSLPYIHLDTQINEVTLADSDQTVSAGQLVKVNAYNAVTNLSGSSGNFMSFSKINHAIHFDFVSGEEFVKVVGTNLSISENATDGTIIKFRVYSNKNSYSNSYPDDKVFSSNYVTLTVDSKKINVKVTTDFKNSVPGTFFGEGEYEAGRRISLSVSANKGFEFVGWYIMQGDNAQLLSDEDTLYFTVQRGQSVYAKFRKSISVTGVTVQSRVYDGTTEIKEDAVAYSFDGLENGHEVGVLGATFSFGDAKAGQNKAVYASYDSLELTGKNADIYKLEQSLPSNIEGEITKRDITISAISASKEYGEIDPKFEYDVSNFPEEGDALVGDLTREAGTNLGTYKILQGTLNSESNPNYNIKFNDNGACLEIVARHLTLENVTVEEKVYDGTTKATVSATLGNVYNNEDVLAQVLGEFVSPNAGEDVEVRITSVTLYGTDAPHYVLEDYPQSSHGKISKRPITVTAQECTTTYGDELALSYSATGLVGDDELSVVLEIDSFYVGEHEIKLGTFDSSNYTIEKFESATCTINPRQAYVQADGKEKTYAEDDPDFTFNVTNLVNGDALLGQLDRQKGEDVGRYQITLGSLNHPNYSIVFTGDYLQITPREITVAVNFLNKEYDATNNVSFDAQFSNNVKNEHFELLLNAYLSDKNCGQVTVNVLSKNIECDNAANYTFTYEFSELEVEITKRDANVFVDAFSKTYGQPDPTFTYTSKNVLDGDELDIVISRDAGEDAGQYKYYIAKEGNPNYNIFLVESYFDILPKQIKVLVKNGDKVFGAEDPEFEYEILDDFCFGQTVEQIITGKISREYGESVGVYNFITSNLSTSGNYVFVCANETKFIINKRPVVVTSFNATKVYGDEDPIFEYSVSNDIEGERLSVKILREYGEDVGDYNLVCGTANDARYTIEFVAGKLSITPCKISVKAVDKAKVYGQADPILTVTITDGFLKNNDRTEDITLGSLIREQGENVGSYVISLGSLTFGENYILNFESGRLEILQRRLSIKAVASTKTYGEQDPTLCYEMDPDGLAFSDTISGNVSRESGESAGTYQILVGDLKVSDNYQVDFVSAPFTITKKRIQVIPTTLSKQYGDEDAEIKYQIQGTLVGDDTLGGTLYRDHDEHEATGRYQIHCALENPNYEIVFGEHYFTILPREVVIQADDCVLHYGDSEEELTFKIVSGSVLEGDNFEGSLQRTKGNSAGTYDIISTLTLGRNYNIHFIKGMVTILPLDITIQSKNYQKVYGQGDPSFVYEIVSGRLINGDKLYGTLTREQGEDVGSYNLINGVYNANYNITLLPASLEILKKDVYLICEVYDKVYDGSTVAYLKNAYVSGIIDDISLDFDRENSADFATEQAGKNIAVRVHDISLVGKKAENYNLVLPQNLYGNITLAEIEKDTVSVSAKDPVLQKDYSLKVASENFEQSMKVQNHRLVLQYNIWMEFDAEKVSPDTMFTVKISLPKSIFKKHNIFVYQKTDDGLLNLVTSHKNKNGEIEILASSLGEFLITIEDDAWIDWATIISMFVVVALCAFVAIVAVAKHEKHKKQLGK